MTKEQLEGLGLNEEQIKEVFKLNGQAVNNAKGDLQSKEQELATVKEQLEQVNKEIEGFKDLNVDEIKAKAEEYKVKLEQSELKAKEELEKIKFEHILENTLQSAKARNIKAVKALLDIEGLTLVDGKIHGLDERLDKLKQENDYLFEPQEVKEESKDKIPLFTRPGDKGKTETLTKEDFNKLGYKERLELSRNQPDLYKQLNE